MFCVCWWGLHETPEPDLSHEPIQGWGAAGNPLSTVSQTCHLPARNADESPLHHETRHQATSCQEHPQCTPALASDLCPWIVYILGLGSESRGAYGFRKRQPDPGRHTRVLGTRKIVGGLQGNDFMPAKGHQVRRKKQEPWPLRSSHQGCSAQLQRDGVDRSCLHAGTREEQTLPFSKEPAAQMERQDRHLRTLKPPLRQL